MVTLKYFSSDSFRVLYIRLILFQGVAPTIMGHKVHVKKFRLAPRIAPVIIEPSGVIAAIHEIPTPSKEREVAFQHLVHAMATKEQFTARNRDRPCSVPVLPTASFYRGRSRLHESPPWVCTNRMPDYPAPAVPGLDQIGIVCRSGYLA